MLEFILQYWMQILFGLIVSILGAGYAGLKRQISKYKNLELGLQCLLRSELIRMHDKYMELSHLCEGCAGTGIQQLPCAERQRYSDRTCRRYPNASNGKEKVGADDGPLKYLTQNVQSIRRPLRPPKKIIQKRRMSWQA